MPYFPVILHFAALRYGCMGLIGNSDEHVFSDLSTQGWVLSVRPRKRCLILFIMKKIIFLRIVGSFLKLFSLSS